MSSLMPPTSSSDPSSPTSSPSFGIPLPLVESPVQEHRVAAHRLDDSINIRGQLQWEKNMKDIGLKRRYKKVSVLMIHWEKQGTDSFDAQQEVCFDWLLPNVFLSLKICRSIVSAMCLAKVIDSRSQRQSSTLARTHSYKYTSTFPRSSSTKMMNRLCSSFTTPVTAPQTKAQAVCS